MHNEQVSFLFRHNMDITKDLLTWDHTMDHTWDDLQASQCILTWDHTWDDLQASQCILIWDHTWDDQLDDLMITMYGISGYKILQTSKQNDEEIDKIIYSNSCVSNLQ